MTFIETSWAKVCVPELLWIALVEKEDFTAGYTLANALVETVAELVPSHVWYGTVTSFSAITLEEGQRIQARLAERGVLEGLQAKIAPLLRLYPDCPLRLLWTGPPELVPVERDVEVIRLALATTLDKYVKPTLLVQVSFILFGILLDRLRIAPGLSLGRLMTQEGMQDVLAFPNTEASKALASSVFSAIPGYFGEPAYDPKSPWPPYFWNRGLELEPCDLGVSAK